MRVLLLRGPGTNCDYETGFAFEMLGAEVDTIYIKRLIEIPDKLLDYQILVIPGGFTYGDDLGAGKVMAIEIERFLFDRILEFVSKDRLVLGICNGFQILVKAGILPFLDGKQHLTLTINKRGRFIDTWTELEVRGGNIFLEGIERIELPVANAEGRLVFKDKEVEERVLEDGLACLFYHGFDPSDSQHHIAGITDKSGRILGLMPHPERNLFPHSHPLWRSGKIGGEGTKIFKNAMRFFE